MLWPVMYRQASTVPFPTFYDGNAVNRMLVLSAFPLPSLQLLRTWYPLGNVVTKLRMLLCLLLKINRWLPALPLWRLSTSLRRQQSPMLRGLAPKCPHDIPGEICIVPLWAPLG